MAPESDVDTLKPTSRSPFWPRFWHTRTLLRGARVCCHMDRLGLLGLAAFIIIVVGLWNWMIRTSLERHMAEDSWLAPFASAAARFW